METLLDQPDLVLLLAQEYYRPFSAIGQVAQSVQSALKEELTRDLAELGMPATSRSENERLAMIAEGLIVLTEALTLSYQRGHYTHREEVLETLMGFARGIIAQSLARDDSLPAQLPEESADLRPRSEPPVPSPLPGDRGCGSGRTSSPGCPR